ncbi:hypothetical protein EH230_14070 [Flavobacterium columnare]|uniref:Uncharacterized protein n=1 Tax=Flavobacterium columnare TaxID=996 RepID=A0A437U8D9_9FLAO|nr:MULTISPECIES: hypothetical protein [Flavobacterium]QYS88244.1 hypothetical protein JJC05_10775 [Flavobacterium davisii]RVU89883.1 hypothetical protein EH230_14070 [Flavobacterium columnare]
MQKIDINYKFLVFLYAYLRQIDLSLDRSRWDSWSNLKEYYKTQINISEVVDQLLKISKLKLDIPTISFFVEEPSLLKRVKDFFLSLIIKKHYISDVEVLYCCQLLNKFKDLLNNNFSSYPLEAEKLRVDISKFNSYVLAPKMAKVDLDNTMRVEHFMQNENLAVIKIYVFAMDALSQPLGSPSIR